AAEWLIKRAAQKALTAGRERNADGIVHAASKNGFGQRMVRTRAENVRGASHIGLLPGALESLLLPRALAPVNPAVAAQVRTVQVVRAAGHCFSVVPDFAFVG